ncbi:MAG: DUF1592 domain-containing protein [Pseudomonadota bacterium]|nr:DUF1592 domain-containing protein [Pseudomonadota bacterium]
MRFIGWLFLSAFLIVFYGNCDGFKSTKNSESGLSSLSGQPTLRRLTNDEINKSLTLILDDNLSRSETFLPAEETNPFDNDVRQQNPSAPLIQGLDNFAADAAQRFMSDPAKKQSVLGCSGLAGADQTCIVSIVKKLGRLFFRRPLTQDEITGLQAYGLKQVTQLGSFDAGVEMLIRVFLQHPKFLYRIEGKTTLTDFDIASRLSFFIWGSGPDDALLKLAESQQLSTPSQVRQVASTMLASPRAPAQIQKLHGFWLGYAKLPAGDILSAAMKQEADTLVRRILVTEQKPWQDLFTSRQTTISSTLGNIYEIQGLTGTPSLVGLPPNRQGILSTAAFLSAVPKFGDTSPTLRGKFVTERLLCKIVPPAPPNTNVDSPPPLVVGQPDCKYNRYDSHRRQGSTCFACHLQMDPIGFGLERFDRTGKYREFDYNSDGSLKSTCFIEGKGQVFGSNAFSGPAELSEILIRSSQFKSCFVRQVFHFGMGSEPETKDSEMLAGLQTEFNKTGFLKDLILALVTSDRFLRR